MHDDDLLADLPPLREDEPASLRQDIADELADHLACAFHRELVKTGDAEAAQTRVLDQFGDPQRIARKLWFQAMWSRIMSQRIVVVSSLTLAVASLAAVGFIGWFLVEQQRRMEGQQQMLLSVVERMLTEFSQRPAPANPSPAAGVLSTSAVPLKIRVVTAGQEQQPFANLSVTLTPEPMKVGDASLMEMTGTDGTADFAYLNIGRYRYTVFMPWGEFATAKFTIHPGTAHEEVLRVPAISPPLANVEVTGASFPASLSELGYRTAVAQLRLQPRMVDGIDWTPQEGVATSSNKPLTASLYVVWTSSGRCWTAISEPQGNSQGGMGGGGFFSVPPEAVASLLSSSLASQFAGSFAGPAESNFSIESQQLLWRESTTLELTTGKYAVTWIGASQQEPARQQPLGGILANLMTLPIGNSRQASTETLLLKDDEKRVWQPTLSEAVLSHFRDAILANPPEPLEPPVRPANPAPPTKPAGLTLELVPENPGQKIHHSANVGLVDELGGTFAIERENDSPRFRCFTPLHPGRYRLMVGNVAREEQDLYALKNFVVKEDERPEWKVKVPDTSLVTNVLLKGPTAHNLTDGAVLQAGCFLSFRGRELDKLLWQSQVQTTFGPQFWLDEKTGLVKSLTAGIDTRTFPGETPAEDRFVTLRPGEYDVFWQFRVVFPDQNRPLVNLPGFEPDVPHPQDSLHTSRVTIQPDQTTAELALPDEVWKKVREKAVELTKAARK